MSTTKSKIPVRVTKTALPAERAFPKKGEKPVKSPVRAKSPEPTEELTFGRSKMHFTADTLIYTIEEVGGITELSCYEHHFDSLDAAVVSLSWDLENQHFDKSLQALKKGVDVAFGSKGKQYFELKVDSIEGLDFPKKFTIYSWSLSSLKIETLYREKIIKKK
jgi:hypothetical protein